jgi:thioredoxin 1
MKNLWKIIIVVLLTTSVFAVVWLRKAENQTQQPPIKENSVQTVESKPSEVNQPVKVVKEANGPLVTTVKAVAPVKLPRFVDLGADKCIPCKMMVPVIDELSKEYKGKLQVEFYDVWKNPVYGQQYGIRVIPTQIFIDPDGKELFRHEGFFSKENILAKWKMFGFDFSKKQ